MEFLRLSKEGQVSLPASILRELGLSAETVLTAELTGDGGILLRPADDLPVEIYDDERLAEFSEENRLTEEQRRRLEKALGRR